jgi:tetratricopeptide (TPR) repeat protein
VPEYTSTGKGAVNEATAGASVPLVGRERELAELDAALAEACEGRGRLFFIAGEPGIGKTRLAETVASRGSARDMVPLWGRAWESAGAPAYWPWTQLLRTLLGTRDSDALEVELGAGAGWLAQVIPELTDRVPGVRAPRSPGAEKARFALFDAVTEFLREAAATDPLLIVLDDLHAADPASLLMFEFVAQAVSESPILLLATLQEAPARSRPEVERLLGVLGRKSRTIPLRGFGDAELARVVELRTGHQWPPQVVKALRETTEGNPFFATEILRLAPVNGNSRPPLDDRGHVSFPLPDTVRETVLMRFESLDPQAVGALETAAVIGREFRLATLGKATDDGERLIELLDQAARAGLVTEVAGAIGRFRFTHNLIRETLYAGLPAVRRVRLHRAVAEAIEDAHGDAPEHLAELAHHFAQASPEGHAQEALDYAVKAGGEAMRMLAYEQAAALFELALEMHELAGQNPKRKAELLLALGRAQARADHLAARETLVAAGDAARAAGDARLMAESGLSMRTWPLGAGVLDEQPGKLLQEALERLDDGDIALRARVLARLSAALYYWAGTEERRKALAGEAVTIARGLGDPTTLAHVLSNAQLATWGPDYTERDLGWMEELLLLFEQVDDDSLALITRNRQIDFLVELADLPAADAALRALELTVGDSSDPRTEGYVHLQRARHAIIEGRYGEAERLNAQAMRVASRLHDTNMSILAQNQVAGIRWLQGRIAEVEQQAEQVIRRDVTPAWAAARALVSCALGRDDEARRVVERLAVNDFADLPRYNGWLVTLALLAETCIHLRDARGVERLYELLLPFADRNVTSPQAVFVGPVARFLGILAASRDRWDPAASHFAAARRAASRMNGPPALMRVALDEAQMLARRGRDDDRAPAIELLAEADAIAAELGLDVIAEEIQELRATLGAPAPSEPVHEPAAADVASASLRREGEMWTFEFGKRSVRMRDSKGVRYLALLLEAPGVEMYAAELARTDSAGAVPGADEPSSAAAAEVGGPGAEDAGPVLDAQAKAAYRRRLEELREELDEATAFNDPERAAGAREEIDFLETELAAAVGLAGRDRKAASTAERARVSVTKAIRATIKRIAEHDPMLARELDTTVRTGTFCVHEPDPRHPLAWRVERR